MKKTQLAHWSKRYGLTVCLLLVIGAVSFWVMRPVGMSGDENHYTKVGNVMAAGLSGERSLQQVILTSVGNGWFMPGTGVLLTPLYLFTDLNPGPSSLRFYALLINLVLLGLIVRELSPRFGPRAANIFLLICLLSPFYVSYLSTAWSDVFSVHAVLLFLLWLDKRQASSRPVTGLAAGALTGALVQMRALYPPLIALPAATWILDALHQRQSMAEAWTGIAKRLLMMLLVFAAVLAPWTYQVNQLYGPTLTVTSPKLSGLMWCTNPVWNKQLPPDTNSYNWGQLYRITENASRKSGLNFTEQAKLLTEEACAEFTRTDRLQRNSRAIDRLFAHPENFMRRFLRLRCEAGQCFSAKDSRRLLDFTRWSWFILLGLGTIICLVPFGRSREGSYLLPMYLKAAACLISVHPFVATAHSRYHVALIPVFAMMVALVASRNFRLLRRDPDERALTALLAAGQLIPYLLSGAILGSLLLWPAG